LFRQFAVPLLNEVHHIGSRTGDARQLHHLVAILGDHAQSLQVLIGPPVLHEPALGQHLFSGLDGHQCGGWVVRLELPENVVLQVLLRVTIGTRKTPLGKVSAKEVH